MCELHQRCSPFLPLACLSLASFFLSGIALGQLLNVDQEMNVRELPSLVAPSRHRADVLLTSLATIIHDPEVCCGKDSALEDSAQAADPKSLKDVAAKLDGRHLLSDGRPILVSAQFIAADAINAGGLLGDITNQRAVLLEWNSHVYVLHGLVYFWMPSGNPDAPGGSLAVIRKFLLWDTRYADARREVVFNRDTDDLSRVQGLLFVEVKPQ